MLQGYREDDGLFLESDTDEQLLVHIPFNQAVRLSAIAIRSMAGGQVGGRTGARASSPAHRLVLPPAPRPSPHPARRRRRAAPNPHTPLPTPTPTRQAPKTVKLFVNRPTLGFAEAADTPAVQDLELGADDLAGRPAALRLVKFGGVNVLTLLVADNQGNEDTTIIHKIVLLGSPGQTFNVGESAAATAAGEGQAPAPACHARRLSHPPTHPPTCPQPPSRTSPRRKASAASLGLTRRALHLPNSDLPLYKRAQHIECVLPSNTANKYCMRSTNSARRQSG